MLATAGRRGGGGRKIFPSYYSEIARFKPNLFKIIEISKQKGHFSSQKRALLVLGKNWGGGHVAPPRSYGPGIEEAYLPSIWKSL